MRTRTITGTYGSGRTKTSIHCYDTNGGTWYAVDGSQNVNFTHEEVQDGVNVELLSDSDTFTWPDGIGSADELFDAVND